MNKQFWFWIIWLLALCAFTGWRAHEDGRRDGRAEVLNMWADKERFENERECTNSPAWVEFWCTSITGRVGWFGGPRRFIAGGRFAGEW